MAVITVSREPGALGEELAARTAAQLGFDLVDKVRLAQLWQEVDLDEARLGGVDEQIPDRPHDLTGETEASIRLLPDLIVQLAEEHDLVIVGRGAQGLFRNRPGTLHIRVVAPRPFRTRQIQQYAHITASQARERMRSLEKRRNRYLRFLYKLNWNDPSLYDLTLRMDRLSIAQATNLILAAAAETQIRQVPRSRIVAGLIPQGEERREHGRFVNAAEAEFARFLDFYQIPYAYEPRSFPLETNAAGEVIEAFTPDFFLPEEDLYIELTTMKQSLVTRKNRKIRKFRKLYPDIQFRIFYQRDYYQLMAKFGLLPPESAGAPQESEP